MLGGSLGFGLGPLIGAIVASKLNWHLAYALLGIPPLVAAVLVFTQLKLKPVEETREPASSQTNKRNLKGVWEVFKPAIGVISISI